MLPRHAELLITVAQACGLEVLLCSAGGLEGGTGDEVTKDSRWPAFLQGLNEKGYFQVCVFVIGRCSRVCSNNYLPRHLQGGDRGFQATHSAPSDCERVL